MSTRRRVAAAIALATLLAFAGCTGTLFEATATPATIPADAVDERDYVHGNTTAVPLRYDVGIGDVVSREVSVTSYVSGYSKTDDGVTGLVLLSTPNVDVLGRSVNPFAHLSNRELTGRALDAVSRARDHARLGNVSDLRVAGSTNRTVLGERTEVLTYEGTLTVDDRPVSVLVHVATVEHGDDVVVAIGVHETNTDERRNVLALIERIEHEA